MKEWNPSRCDLDRDRVKASGKRDFKEQQPDGPGSICRMKNNDASSGWRH
jgi:hypothetical protein